MKIQYKNGLLYASLEIIYNGRRKMVDDIIIDTGAAHTIISPDAVIELGVEPEAKDIKIDFGLIDDCGKINGLLGLDILLNLNVNIRLKDLTLTMA